MQSSTPRTTTTRTPTRNWHTHGKQTGNGIRLDIPEAARDSLDTIIVLKLNSSAVDVRPLASTSGTAIKGASISASNTHQGDATYGPDKAVDGLPSTRWATDARTHQAWLEVTFKKPTEVGEACGNRVQAFVLECKANETWRPFYRGKTIGENFKTTFSPVKAKQFRLNLLNATEGPALWELRFLPPAKS